MERRSFLKYAAGACAIGAAGRWGRAEEAKLPNVILVITDDQGYGDLGRHGNKVIRTPNMDRLYDQSTRLTQYHVCPTCSPTRSSLLTGRYCNRVGVWHTIMGRSQLRRDETTMADIFKANGYTTGMFGKWHLGDNYPFSPQFRGFDTVVYHGGGGVGNAQDAWGNSYFDDTYCHNGAWKKHKGYCTDEWFNEARAFISKQAKGAKPFFCYLSTNAPHSPFRVPDKYADPYRNKKFPDWKWGVPARFFGMVACIDENLGKLMADLKARGIEDNTVLIFTTDNGTSSREEVRDPYNAGMRGYKGSAYDGGHRVPFFIRWPGKINAGQDITHITAHIDIVPTLVGLLGLKETKHLPWDGKDLTPLIKNPKAAWPARTIITDSQRIEDPKKWRQSSVMTDRWRLVNGRELHDINADPGQAANLAGKHPDVVARLRAEYDKWWASTSRRFGEYTRTILGSDRENPVMLSSHDWHGAAAQGAWHQYHVKKGAKGSGFWAVEVEREGEYEITLRRWPRGNDTPLRKDFINITRATLSIGKISRTQDVAAEANEAVFKLKLPAGKVRMLGGFEDAEARKRGVFYAYVKRL